MKLQLPSVTLLIIDCVNTKRAVNVVERCKSLCDFGAVKFLTSLPTDYEHAIQIMPLNSLIAYSVFMITESYKYIDTSNVLVVQRDGWILNTSAWKEEWLRYDYIAPLFVQYDKMGSGGFSLRSKRIMDHVASLYPKWDGSQQSAEEIQEGMGYYEDGVISLTGLESKFKFASLNEAAIFGQGGNRNPKYYRGHPFGFHGAWQNVNHETGFVSPLCEHEDLVCDCTYAHKTFLKSMAE